MISAKDDLVKRSGFSINEQLTVQVLGAMFAAAVLQLLR